MFNFIPFDGFSSKGKYLAKYQFFVRVLYFISLLQDQFTSFIKNLFIGVEPNLDLKTVSLHRMRYFKKDVTGNLTKKKKQKQNQIKANTQIITN